jgi:hypothetical protein
MRKLKALRGALMVLAIALLPAGGALFQLGVALDKVAHLDGPARETTVETVGTYEVDSTRFEAGLRLHAARVARPVAAR